ncbi:NYN domain-containing protein [uncultured Brachybacterium sp.]|uniref:NYN domain-containing protein n=1 Tax=uncultured Brachybacterium sp. TaxID=189680 RepID=UPI00260AA701|nr:NYN domain-containing protein [uncultured Brachybacterium sp.]
MRTTHGPAGVSKARGWSERTLYLVDIENMVGSAELSQGDVSRTQRRIEGAIEPSAGDHTVIAASHHNAAAMHFGWAGPAQRVVRSGKDGADLALLAAVADVSWVAERYGRVVLASGDHTFTFAVTSLKNAGVEVLVIRPDLGFSSALRRVAGADVTPLGSTIPATIINLFTRTKDAA